MQSSVAANNYEVISSCSGAENLSFFLESKQELDLTSASVSPSATLWIQPFVTKHSCHQSLFANSELFVAAPENNACMQLFWIRRVCLELIRASQATFLRINKTSHVTVTSCDSRTIISSCRTVITSDHLSVSNTKSIDTFSKRWQSARTQTSLNTLHLSQRSGCYPCQPSRKRSILRIPLASMMCAKANLLLLWLT